jgi:hypothetical protein
VNRRLGILAARSRVGFVPLALVAAVCLLASGCSPGAEYPTIFPAVHDMPPPRADTPMDPDQVQQATEALITERNHLTTQTQGSGQSSGQGTGQAKNAANPPSTAAKPPAAKNQSAAAGAANAPAADGTQTAGAAGTETK